MLNLKTKCQNVMMMAWYNGWNKSFLIRKIRVCIFVLFCDLTKYVFEAIHVNPLDLKNIFYKLVIIIRILL